MSGEESHTNIETWICTVYHYGQDSGSHFGQTFHVKGVSVDKGFLIHKDIAQRLDGTYTTQIQFNGDRLAYRISVDFLLSTSVCFNNILWCDKCFMSTPIKLEVEEYDNVEKSRWIK